MRKHELSCFSWATYEGHNDKHPSERIMCDEACTKHQGIQGEEQRGHHGLPSADHAGASVAFPYGKPGKADGHRARRLRG